MSENFALKFIEALIKVSTRLSQMQISVTILGDLLDFGQLFKAFGNN